MASKKRKRPTDPVIEPPSTWRIMYDNIKEMRKERDAIVDSLGAEMLGDRSDPKLFRYQTLIGLMLSSQTRDEVTAAAMERLKKHGLTPEKVQRTPLEELQALIKPVGFWRRKGEYIKETTDALVREYGGDIPRELKKILALKGVGPKMALLCVLIAWDDCQGIAVDVHVHRIANRLKWVNTSTPEKTRAALESWLPRDLWKEINLLLVGFGQQRCAATPNCKGCLNRQVCPVGKKLKK